MMLCATWIWLEKYRGQRRPHSFRQYTNEFFITTNMSEEQRGTADDTALTADVESRKCHIRRCKAVSRV